VRRFPEVAVRISVIVVLGLALAGTSVRSADKSTAADDRAREAIVKALAAGGDIPGQARNLVALAWPAGKRDEAIAARARRELVNFGEHSLGPLRTAMNSVKLDYTVEVMATTLGAQRMANSPAAAVYLATAIDSLWVGSHDAKALAIDALAYDRTPMAVAPMIDSAIDDPTLARQVIEALGTMRFQQARFYLEKVMMEGPPELRPVAASSLAQIGGLAVHPLRNALKAPSRDARLLAARVLMPVATEYDLGALYEYLEKHGDDDPALSQDIKSLSVKIEKAIAARDAKEAAKSPENF
jgi:hypothetical protein